MLSYLGHGINAFDIATANADDLALLKRCTKHVSYCDFNDVIKFIINNGEEKFTDNFEKLTDEEQKQFLKNIEDTDYIRTDSGLKHLFRNLPKSVATKLMVEEIIFLPQFLYNSQKSLEISNSVKEILNELFASFPFTEDAYQQLKERFPGYKGYPLAITNHSIPEELKTKVFKENYIQKDFNTYVKFLQEHLSSYNDLDSFIQATVIQNNRVKNKKDNVEEIFLRIVCGDNTSSYYRYHKEELFKKNIPGCDEFFEKYKEYINFETIDSMFEYKVNSRVNTQRKYALEEVIKYLAKDLSVEEQLVVVEKYPRYGDILFNNISDFFGNISINSDAAILKYAIVRYNRYYYGSSKKTIRLFDSGIEIQQNRLSGIIDQYFNSKKNSLLTFLASNHPVAVEICEKISGTNSRYDLTHMTLDLIRRSIEGDNADLITLCDKTRTLLGMDESIFAKGNRYNLDSEITELVYEFHRALKLDLDYLEVSSGFANQFINVYLKMFESTDTMTEVLSEFSGRYNLDKVLNFPYNTVHKELPTNVSTISELFLDNVKTLSEAAHMLLKYDDLRENTEYSLQTIADNLDSLSTNIELLISI